MGETAIGLHPRGVRFAWFAYPWPHRGHLVGSLNTPARCLVRLVRHSVATPWPAYIKVVAVKPLFSRHAASARRSEGEICTRSTRDKVVKWHIGENSIGRFFGGGRSTRSTRHRTPGGPGVLWRVERPARNAGTTGQDAVMTPS